MKRCKRGSANLPGEIMTEIFLRLPARSVLRFRAVCRAWSVLLRSPSFTDAYSTKEDARRKSKFVFFAPSAVYCCTQGTAITDLLFTVGRLRTDFVCLSTRPCRGLLLFSDTRSATYWVCNPSTGEFTCLPRPRRRSDFSSAGLVFDDQTKECKVVHLFYHGGIDIPCEVYTLSGQNRRWRPATGKIPLFLQIPALKAVQIQDAVTKVPPVFADGYLHWLLYPNVNTVVPGPGRAAVLCFSVAEETFSIVSAPASKHVAEYKELEEQFPAVPIHLAELESSLCMVHDLRRMGHGANCLDIWVLRDHKASHWSLDCRIAVTPVLARDVSSPRFITILGYCGGGSGNKGKKILLATSQHTVHSYSLETGNVQTVLSVPETAIGHQKEATAALQLAFYEDSLIRIGGERHQEKEVLSALTMVLLRLPVKSIIQCMLVCRQWCALIESENFVQSHMSTRRPKGIFMVTNGGIRRNFFDFAPVETWLQPNTALADTLINDKIICSKPCHGLNLISTSSDDYLCNPCTGSIRCLGNRGRLHQSRKSNSRANRHAFTVGRSIGLGFDQSTGEHVAVEIGHFHGSLACMVKTESRDVWSYVGKPPVPVTDMPPAYIDGTLYWLSEQVRPCEPQSPQERVVVAFGISARTFSSLPCHPCQNYSDRNTFLVELNGMLSLVVGNRETEELDIWMMHKHGTWANAFKICLGKQPNYSLKRQAVVPLEIDNKHSKILLNTGRALGYYDAKTKAIHTLYSADQLQLPESSLVFPMLYEENLVRVQDDQLLDCTSPTVSHEQCGCNEQHVCSNSNKGVMSTCNQHNRSVRSIFHECENSTCQNIAATYRRCCRRVFCPKCADQCLKHSREQHISLPTRWWLDVITRTEDLGLPLDHPFVPGPDYCYYYSTRNADMARHIFVSLKDYARKKQPCRLTECGYRMEGQVIRETWVRRYLADDPGR